MPESQPLSPGACTDNMIAGTPAIVRLQRPKAAGDFLPKLHHAPVAFGLVVGERNGRIAKEAQCILFARREAQQEIMAGSARRMAAPFAADLYGSLCQRRLGSWNIIPSARMAS
jgi:hypothetical protein